jgi:hypothetical protein
MKNILVLLLFPISVFSQDYKTFGDFQYCKDTIVFKGIKLRPGDTVRLGFGSGVNKDFLFIFQQTSNMKKRVRGLDHPLPQMANVFMILKRVDEGHGKEGGVPYDFVAPIFGYKKEDEKIEWMAQLTNATESKELLIKPGNQ